ncbi:MAG: FecR domain-containing protein, partial [Pseudomonadota bacterium]
ARGQGAVLMSLDDWLGDRIPDVIMDDAAQWMTRLDADRCNTGDRLAFARWLEEDTRHRAAFEELSEVWARLHTLTEIEVDAEAAPVLAFPERPRQPAARSSRRPARSDRSALAAAAVLAIGLLAHALLRTPADVFATGAGEISMITLSDGSRVELNARSEIRVRMDERDRVVSLLRGEAVFQVSPGKRPFVVEAPAARVHAGMSSFAVDIGGGGLEVGVIEGEVTVVPAAPAALLTEYDSPGATLIAKPVRLVSGEALAIHPDGRRRLAWGPREVSAALSWRDGVVVFDELPVRLVVEEMRRYGDVIVHVADDRIGGIRVSGSFPTNDPAAYLPELAAHADIVVDEGGDDWIVLRSSAAPISQ